METIYRFVIQHIEGKYLGRSGLTQLDLDRVLTFETSYEATRHIQKAGLDPNEYQIAREGFSVDLS